MAEAVCVENDYNIPYTQPYTFIHTLANYG